MPVTKNYLEIVREYISYDKDTGIFKWIKSPRSNVSSGDEVGCVAKIKNNQYIKMRIFGNNVFAHRLAFFYVNGEMPDGCIDHINGNGLDNRFKNLRIVDRYGNAKNQKKSSRNTSGICGISWDSSRNLWRADFRSNGKFHHVGRFLDIGDAKKSLDMARIGHNFSKRHGK